jgi:hypothetical protein
MAGTPKLKKEQYQQDQKIFKEVLGHIEQKKVDVDLDKLQGTIALKK